MPVTLKSRPATSESVIDTPYDRQLPLNTAAWFMLSGMLIVTSPIVAIFNGLTSTVFVLTALAAVAAFICGSMTWSDRADSRLGIQPFREEDIDWKEVESTLNIAGWLMVSGAALGMAAVAAPLYAHTMPTFIGVEVLSAIAACIGNVIATGIWDLRQERTTDRIASSVRPLVSNRR